MKGTGWKSNPETLPVDQRATPAQVYHACSMQHKRAGTGAGVLDLQSWGPRPNRLALVEFE